MRRTVPLICVCLFLVTAAESAFAQQRLLVRMGSEVVELDSRLPSLGAIIRRFPLPEELARTLPPVVTFGGGKSLAWTAHGAVLLLDTFSGAVQRFTFPGFIPGDVIGTDGNARLVVVGDRVQGGSALVADARSGRVHFVDLGPASMVGPIAYASASDVLFVAKRRPTAPQSSQTFHDVDVIHAATGALVKTLDISPAYVDNPSPWGTWVSVNAAGTRLFVSLFGGGTFAFDVVSGTLAAHNGALEAGHLDELRSRFVAGGPSAIAAFSADSLRFLGKVSVPRLPLPPPGQTSGTLSRSDLDVSGLSATIFVLETLSTAFASHSACWSQLTALHADTGQVRRTVNMTDALGDGACRARQIDLIRITEPAPPSAPTANVSGGHVTLNWQAPFGATQYEVEVGSAPGLADITTIRVTDSQLVVERAPTGAYYVRVRAINTIGKSGASQEVRVFVQ